VKKKTSSLYKIIDTYNNEIYSTCIFKIFYSLKIKLTLHIKPF